jgi:CcmD family protein
MSRLAYSFFASVMLCGLLAAGPALGDKVPPRPPAPATAPAGAGAQPTPPAADAEGFVPESRPPTMSAVDNSIPAAPLVATAYGFIWLAVLAFVLFTLRRTRSLEQEIEQLAERIRRATPSS